jgi:hypothetical protein
MGTGGSTEIPRSSVNRTFAHLSRPAIRPGVRQQCVNSVPATVTKCDESAARHDRAATLAFRI